VVKNTSSEWFGGSTVWKPGCRPRFIKEFSKPRCQTGPLVRESLVQTHLLAIPPLHRLAKDAL